MTTEDEIRLENIIRKGKAEDLSTELQKQIDDGETIAFFADEVRITKKVLYEKVKKNTNLILPFNRTNYTLDEFLNALTMVYNHGNKETCTKLLLNKLLNDHPIDDVLWFANTIFTSIMTNITINTMFRNNINRTLMTNPNEDQTNRDFIIIFVVVVWEMYNFEYTINKMKFNKLIKDDERYIRSEEKTFNRYTKTYGKDDLMTLHSFRFLENQKKRLIKNKLELKRLEREYSPENFEFDEELEYVKVQKEQTMETDDSYWKSLKKFGLKINIEDHITEFDRKLNMGEQIGVSIVPKFIRKGGVKSIPIEVQLNRIDNHRKQLNKKFLGKYNPGKNPPVDPLVMSTFIVSLNMLDHLKQRLMEEYVNPIAIPTDYFVKQEILSKVNNFVSTADPLRNIDEYKKDVKEGMKEGTGKKKKGGLFGKIFRKSGTLISAGISPNLHYDNTMTTQKDDDRIVKISTNLMTKWSKADTSDLGNHDLGLYSEMIGDENIFIPKVIQDKMHGLIQSRIRIRNKSQEKYSTTMMYIGELIRNFVDTQSSIGGTHPYTKVPEYVILESPESEPYVRIYNQMITLGCNQSREYLLKAPQKISGNTKCVFSGYIKNGITSGKNVWLAKEYINSSKVVMFIPIPDTVLKKGIFNRSFTVRPLVISKKRLYEFIDGIKTNQTYNLLVIEHKCTDETFSITYLVQHPTSVLVDRGMDIKLQSKNNFFINCFRNYFDGFLKDHKFEDAVRLFNIAYRLTKNHNQITCFEILRVSLSSFVKRIVHNTLEEGQIGIKRDNHIINRISYCSALLTILSCYFDDMNINIGSVKLLLKLVRVVILKHLILYVFNKAKNEGLYNSKCMPASVSDRRSSTDVTMEYSKEFINILHVNKGPKNFIEKMVQKTPYSGNTLLKSMKSPGLLFHVLRPLEDPFISSMFISGLFPRRTHTNIHSIRLDRWVWESIDDLNQFIKAGFGRGNLKGKNVQQLNNMFIDIIKSEGGERLTQQCFDDMRIKRRTTPIHNTMIIHDPKITTKWDKCFILNGCTFPKIIFSEQPNPLLSNSVRSGKIKSLNENIHLLKITPEYVIGQKITGAHQIGGLIDHHNRQTEDDHHCISLLNTIEVRVENGDAKNEILNIQTTCNKMLNIHENNDVIKICKRILSKIQ